MRLSHILKEKARVQKAESPEELEYLQKAANLLADNLNIADREIIITFDPPYDLDKNQYGATVGVGKKPNKIFILIDKGISTGEKVRTLAHEMVHAQQISSGRLVISELKNKKINGEWEGEPFTNTQYSKSNPWEIEAHTKEKELQRYIIKKLGNFISD